MDDASGEVSADGNNTLVYFEMTNGAPINWAFIQVTVTVDGGAQTVCEGPSNVDETGCKVVDNGDGDTEFEVTDGRIIIQEESQICESACSIVVTIFDTQNQRADVPERCDRCPVRRYLTDRYIERRPPGGPSAAGVSHASR